MCCARWSAIAVALAAAACTQGPDRIAAPRFELVDPALRLDAGEVNAHTYGSFVIPFAGGPVAILSGPANFPGNPPGGPGTCRDGLWINAKGKPTAGTLDHPHPHCTTAGSAAVVVLEPISSRAFDPRVACGAGQLCHYLYFSQPKLDNLDVEFEPGIKGSGSQTNGVGMVYAYAIDASTLNGTNLRVGIISFDLGQYDEAGQDLFGTCALDDLNTYQCLPRVITASYQPLAVGGVGTATTVTGFLWWAPASSPYNY